MPAPHDPREFYVVAQELAAIAPQRERHRRSAISRAYYACFHLAKAGLERGGRWSAGTANAHDAVINELKRRQRFRLGEDLKALKRYREHADYILDQPVDEQVFAQAMANAAVLRRQLETF